MSTPPAGRRDTKENADGQDTLRRYGQEVGEGQVTGLRLLGALALPEQ
jgi:hypothetical protein